MRKPKITPTPWIYAGGDNHSCEINIGDSTASITRHDKNTGIFCLTRDEMEANAQAIVTAVNCTYGANINPEKIQELIDKADNILAHAEEFGLAYKLYQELKEALNNIKYKD